VAAARTEKGRVRQFDDWLIEISWPRASVKYETAGQCGPPHIFTLPEALRLVFVASLSQSAKETSLCRQIYAGLTLDQQKSVNRPTQNMCEHAHPGPHDCASRARRSLANVACILVPNDLVHAATDLSLTKPVACSYACERDRCPISEKMVDEVKMRF
jgi:hypothetical protein